LLKTEKKHASLVNIARCGGSVEPDTPPTAGYVSLHHTAHRPVPAEPGVSDLRKAAPLQRGTIRAC